MTMRFVRYDDDGQRILVCTDPETGETWAYDGDGVERDVHVAPGDTEIPTGEPDE